MNVHQRLLALLFLIALVSAPAFVAAADEPPKAPDGPFLVKPYLQLGAAPDNGSSGDLMLLWQTDDVDAEWSVETRSTADQLWRSASAATSRRIAVPGIEPHRVYRASLSGLAAGESFGYRVSKAKTIVFSSEGRARKSASQPYRFVAFGDCAQGTPEQKAIAFRAYQEHPDFVMIPGDIVYARGRVSEYREKFWPVYNADEASPTSGAPLLRSTLFLAAPGNHDIATRDLEKYPDGLAYFYYWDQPLNGPAGKEGGPFVASLTGSDANISAFRDAAGKAFPRMANFSFDYGNAHWTVLDANPYVDWTDGDLRGWVERDLASAQGASWRFVTFHQPGFNSAKKHFSEQQMRRMAPVFEAGRVDVVFSGHVHNYQRTFPLRFAVAEARPPGRRRTTTGRWTAGSLSTSRSTDGSIPAPKG